MKYRVSFDTVEKSIFFNNFRQNKVNWVMSILNLAAYKIFERLQSFLWGLKVTFITHPVATTTTTNKILLLNLEICLISFKSPTTHTLFIFVPKNSICITLSEIPYTFSVFNNVKQKKIICWFLSDSINKIKKNAYKPRTQ